LPSQRASSAPAAGWESCGVGGYKDFAPDGALERGSATRSDRWGEATDEPGRAVNVCLTMAREDARPTEGRCAAAHRAALQPQRGYSIQPSVGAQRLRWGPLDEFVGTVSRGRPACAAEAKRSRVRQPWADRFESRLGFADGARPSGRFTRRMRESVGKFLHGLVA